MDSRSWLHYLHSELARRGLPADYVARVLEELNDHQSDLWEEKTMNASQAESRLGDARQVAGTIAVEFRKRNFASRHPWLALVILPLPMLVIGWTIATIAGLLAVGLADGILGPQMNWSSATRGWIATLTAVSVAIAPPTLVFVVLCRWGRRASAGWAPCLLGFTLAAAATLMFHGSWALASAPGNSTVSIGFAWGAASISLARFGQLLVPLAIAGLYAWATRPAVAMPRAAVVSADSNRALAA